MTLCDPNDCGSLVNIGRTTSNPARPINAPDFALAALLDQGSDSVLDASCLQYLEENDPLPGPRDFRKAGVFTTSPLSHITTRAVGTFNV